MSSRGAAMECDEKPGPDGTADVVDLTRREKRRSDPKTDHDESPKEIECIEIYDSSESSATNLGDEGDPFFVEDRTNSFQLNHEILFDSFEKNNTSKIETRPWHMHACWNCNLTDHSLSNCPEPRMPRMIAMNRQAFHMNKARQSNAKHFRNRSGRQSVRYFFDGPNNICNDFIPGRLSDELSDALSFPENGIPIHVYRMREHGYPNGWLQDAREEFSGISIFTAPNVCLPFPERQIREDNVFHCTIYENKLHSYPGFNAPCPENFVDDYSKYDCPEYNPDLSLKFMNKKITNTIFDNKPISLNKNVKTGLASRSNDAVLNNGSYSQSKTSKEGYKIPSSPESGEITDEDSDAQFSLNTMGKSATENIKTCSGNTFENDSLLSYSIKSENSSTPICKATKKKFGDVKSEVFGTPVLKRFSSYKHLPTQDKFAKGMVDMINYENLPNAVGTYQKLKVILKDARKTLNNLN